MNKKYIALVVLLALAISIHLVLSQEKQEQIDIEPRQEKIEICVGYTLTGKITAKTSNNKQCFTYPNDLTEKNVYGRYGVIRTENILSKTINDDINSWANSRLSLDIKEPSTLSDLILISTSTQTMDDYIGCKYDFMNKVFNCK